MNKGREGNKNSNWKGGLLKGNCLTCGNLVESKPSQIKRGRGKFCSKKCYSVWLSGALKGENGNNWKGGLAKTTCEICKNPFTIKPSVIADGRGRFCSRKCCHIWRRSICGEKSPKWQGGITPLNAKIRRSIEYRLWRESVFARDNWTCQECRKRDGRKLNAHHIHPFAQFPELRFAIDNGITLCQKCHKKKRGEDGKKGSGG